MPDKKTVKIKDHTENDFAGCDKLITNIGGRRIELDKAQQKEVLEFIYAIGSRESDGGDKTKNNNMTFEEKLRCALLLRMRHIIYNAPKEAIIDIAIRFLGDSNNKELVN